MKFYANCSTVAENESQEVLQGSYCIPKKSRAAAYLSWLGDHQPFDLSDAQMEIIKENDFTQKPFFSVVTRTQGKRAEELEEVLLCLAGQDETDFEVLLMGHNLDSDGRDLVMRLVQDCPTWLYEKIRVILVNGGGRTEPLNVAFALAQGDYITILDDDDLVFDNWLSVFRVAARENWGSILFSYVFTQRWEAIVSPSGKRMLRSMDAPVPEYCKSFDAYEQLSTNHCPTMGLAFPAYIFQDLGFHFDASLSTTEDWDFLMRSQFVCDVVTSDEPVAIYRLWQNALSSHTLHQQREWDENRWRIQDKFSEMPILFPVGASEGFIDRGGNHTTTVTIPERGIKLYINTGTGYTEGKVANPVRSDEDDDTFVFDKLEQWGRIQSLRIDPRHSGNITITELAITVVSTDGSARTLNASNVYYNGFTVDDSTIAFLKDDPQIRFDLNGASLSSMSVHMKMRIGVSDRDIDYIFGTRIILKIKEYYHKIGRALRRLAR